MSKKWPTSDDLLAWFLHDKIDMGEIHSPIDAAKVLRQFRETPAKDIHKELWTEYEDFRNEFVSYYG